MNRNNINEWIAIMIFFYTEMNETGGGLLGQVEDSIEKGMTMHMHKRRRNIRNIMATGLGD